MWNHSNFIDSVDICKNKTHGKIIFLFAIYYKIDIVTPSGSGGPSSINEQESGN